MKKRVTSLFLALLMAVTLLPVQVLAEEPAAPDTAADTHQAAEVQEPVETETETDAPVPQKSAQDAAPLSTGAVYTGTLGENVSWSLDTGTGALTVTGSGSEDRRSYYPEGSPLWNYRSYIKSVAIADTVTYVGGYVFYGCANLTTVDFGGGITEIGHNAFDGCKALTEIVLPDSVTTIGYSAFENCSSLTSVTMGSSITTIGGSAFEYCTSLREIVIPDSVTSIDSSTFCYCTYLTSVTMGSGVTSIGDSAFEDCASLTEIVIPDSVISIGSSAFRNCTYLTSVTMGSGVTKIGSEAFAYCNKLNKIIISAPDAWLNISFKGYNSNPLYTAHALYVGDELLTDLVIPGTVTEINEYALYGCTSITSVYIPQSVTSIDQYAFNGMSSLKTVRYAGSQSNWLKIRIGSYNDSLTGLTPEFDQSLADYCRITTAATEHGTVAVDNAMAKVGDTVTITAIPAAGYAVESYLVDGVAIPSGGSTFTVTGDHVVSATFVKNYDVAGSGTAYGSCGANIQWALDTEGTLHIYGTGAMSDYRYNNEAPFFPYRADIRAVQLSDGITTIGDRAFYECSGLTEIVLPGSVTSIGHSAFYECRGLTEIVIPDSVTSIGSSAFQWCGLASAEFLGNAPATFSNSAFRDVSSNFTIFYHSGTTGWTSPTWNGYNAVCRDKITTDFSTLDDNNRNGQGIYFRLNTTSKTATVGVGTTADNNAGYDGGQNGSIVIPDTVTKNGETYNVIGINQYAFANCAWVNTVSIGKNVTSIIPSAFQGCKNLTAITVDANNLQFADQDGVLFDKCGLSLYVYPAGRAAATYDIPDTCDTVGTQSFYGAVNLTSLTVPTSVKNIGAKAFAQCNALEEITLPFIGSSVEDNNTFNYVFNSDRWSSYGGVPQSLKTVTILTANLVPESFYNCTFIENIYLPNCAGLTKIPDSCFFGCTALQTLVFGGDKTDAYSGVRIPDTVTTIDYGAFYNCKSLTSITLGAGVNYISSLAFSSCSGLTRFSVVSGNTAFTADEWGVLYSKDMSVLRYYPSARPWPYYNVAESATAIAENAFTYCDKLVNLFIPKTVTRFGVYQRNYNGVLNYEGSSTSGISNCPNTTVCCYMDSAAARYAINNSLTWWYMDNYDMQGIKVTGLPEYTVVNAQGQVLSCSAYVTAQYGDKELQLDDYTIQPVSGYGEQTLTFSSGGVSTQIKANVIRQGDINGNATAQSDIDASDMQCLYELLTTGQCQSQIKNREDLELVADVNNDDHVDVYDLQMLYEAVSGISKL